MAVPRGPAFAPKSRTTSNYGKCHRYVFYFSMMMEEQFINWVCVCVCVWLGVCARSFWFDNERRAHVRRILLRVLHDERIQRKMKNLIKKRGWKTTGWNIKSEQVDTTNNGSKKWQVSIKKSNGRCVKSFWLPSKLGDCLPEKDFFEVKRSYLISPIF